MSSKDNGADKTKGRHKTVKEQMAEKKAAKKLKKHNRRIEAITGTKIDANASPTQAWDDLHELYSHSKDLLSKVSDVRHVLTNEELNAKATPEEKSRLESLSGMLVKDMRDYASRLEAIREKHKDRTATSELEAAKADGEDYEFAAAFASMEALGIGQEYSDWEASQQSVIIPTVLEITDIAKTVSARDGKDITKTLKEDLTEASSERTEG